MQFSWYLLKETDRPLDNQSGPINYVNSDATTKEYYLLGNKKDKNINFFTLVALLDS